MFYNSAFSSTDSLTNTSRSKLTFVVTASLLSLTTPNALERSLRNMPSLHAAMAVAEYNPPPNIESPPEDENTKPSSGPYHSIPGEIVPTSGRETVNSEGNHTSGDIEDPLGAEVSDPEGSEPLYGTDS